MTPLPLHSRWRIKNSITKARWLFLAIALLSVSVWSDVPSPGSTKSAGKPKADSAQQGENFKATEKFPVFVEISKAPVIQIETTEEKKDGDGYSSSEWWVVYVTGLLSFITLGLAIYTAAYSGERDRSFRLNVTAAHEMVLRG